MKPFLSSTFLDLVKEREAVLGVLRKKRLLTQAMEDFLATPNPPLATALEHLHNSDVMLLIIGFKAGSLLAGGSGSTYTSAEYDELLKLRKAPLVFVKQKKRFWERKASWHNEERDPAKRKALDAFKARVTENHTPDYFTTAQDLVNKVLLALEQWQEMGRPGARKTFASTADYFEGKNPTGHSQILDFGTTLLGRDEQIRALNEFAADPTQRVCIVSGRGGIGKSKLLYDWARARPAEVIFLKDEPHWHGSSKEEIPHDCEAIIVDDAHRQEAFGKVLQILRDTASHRNLKLIVSTRPGGAHRLLQEVCRKLDFNQVTQLPELKELDREQSRALAAEVLGDEFLAFAYQLAEIGGNSPLVIVAGGRLIANRKIHPSALTTLQDFRSTIFNRLLQDMDIEGPQFVINPPRRVLDLIAALGPVNVETREFQRSAEEFLDRPIDEVLATIDALTSNGIVTPRPKPVRIIPDVLSDYILEERCISVGGQATHYADRVYEYFGAHSLKELMRNLSELDWRRGQAGETGLSLLNGIWHDIGERFRAGDEYARRCILTDLAGAAIYQPDHVIALVRDAIANPIEKYPTSEANIYRAGQEHVLSALPDLLEATAYHPEHLKESVTTLWKLAKQNVDRNNRSKEAESVLKRLASWHRFGNPAMNFAMLVQAIRLTRCSDAFTGEFNPFTLIKQILEREGEFNEWPDDDDNTVSLGSFGLNYAAVGPVRGNALDFVEFALSDDGAPALRSVEIMTDLLYNHCTRFGREPSEEEIEWQNRERERCLQALAHRYEQPASAVLKAKVLGALRSATAISCPEAVRQAANKALATITIDDAVAVVDAICTAEHDLPVLSARGVGMDWEQPIADLMTRGRSSLERLVMGAGNQARFTIDQTRACIEVRVKTGGFHRFMLTFSDRTDYLTEMAGQLMAHPQAGEMVGHLSSVLSSIHSADPLAFRQQALSAIELGAIHVIHAAAHNLRVFEGATEADIAVIQAYGGYPDPVAKRGAIRAIAYMGKFVELRRDLKEAVLSVHTDGDPAVATDLVDAFGPYGIPLTMLTREDAARVASEFLLVRDWGIDQGAIPRFLGQFAALFPDETYDLLVRRIELNSAARKDNQPLFRTFDFVREHTAFGSVPTQKRLELARNCIARLVRSEEGREFATLFWDLAGYDEAALLLVVDAAKGIDELGVRNIEILIGEAVPRLAFERLGFVKSLLSKFSGPRRERLVEALAHQARRSSDGMFAGDLETHLAKQKKQFTDQVAAFPDESDLDDLAKALRGLCV